MCPRHGEAKPTHSMETLEFGRESLLQGQARCSCSKTPNSPMVSGENILPGKAGGEGCRVCGFFLIGWRCSSDLGSSLKFPSPSWVGALVPTEEQKALPLRRNLDPALIATLQLIFLF